ncbi:LysE family translocator [uncultured Martelella sp.]|uniref:LysE family translocator n=1 Tax=uncultured Martelella sp. TaxID=392331 RepID=UPI0029C94FB6|nr:LysE family translocator [uncultured Martelella sp.]
MNSAALFGPLVLAWTAYFIAVVSPGPATLAIAGTAMGHGRRQAIALANGALTGSFFWAVLAGTGMAAVVTKLAYGLMVLKIVGGCYLLYLAFKSFRAATRSDAHAMVPKIAGRSGFGTFYRRGLYIHLTNPKAIFTWVSLVSIGLPQNAGYGTIILFIVVAEFIGFLTFNTLALLFSSGVVVRGYHKARRAIEGTMAVLFTLAGFKLLTTRI